MKLTKSLQQRSARIAEALTEKKQRIATVESTTGGLIGASLLSCPGASKYYISSCVVYSRRGYKQFLPEDVLEESQVWRTEHNYKNRENYVESKRVFVTAVAKAMRERLRADWLVCESGTSGPEFYIPGVESGFTAIGICGPGLNPGDPPREWVKIVETGHGDREKNMWEYTDHALAFLESCVLGSDSKL